MKILTVVAICNAKKVLIGKLFYPLKDIKINMNAAYIDRVVDLIIKSINKNTVGNILF